MICVLLPALNPSPQAGRPGAGRSPYTYVLAAVTSRAASPVDFRDTSRLTAAGYDAATRWLAGPTSAVAA